MKRGWGGGVLVWLSLLLLAGCRLPGTVRPTVKFGLVAPFEGRYRYVGYDVIYAVRLALREVNLVGGVGGYGVELAAYDDAADPERAVAAARQLALDRDVVAVSGHFMEETTAAGLPVYAEGGLPLVSPLVVGQPPSGTAEVFFRLGPDGERLAAVLLEQATAGGRSFALVSDGGPLGEAVLAEAARTGRQPVVAVAPDDADGVEAVLISGARAVVCTTPPVVAGEVLAVLRSSGWQGELIGGPELTAPAFAAVAGEVAGVTLVVPYLPPTDGFAAAYREVSGGVGPGGYAGPAYEAARRLLTALARDIAQHGTPSREGMVAALAGFDWGECLPPGPMCNIISLESVR